MVKTLKFGMFLLILLALTGCGNEQQNQKEKGKLNIYTTVYPLQYFAERIGGEHVSVTSIYPPGTDEHTFEPSQQEMMKLAEADLFFYIGYGLEGFATKAEQSLKNEHVKMVATGEKIAVNTHEEEAEEHHDAHHHGSINPHLWLDPIYAQELSSVIRDYLIEMAPEYETEFQKNYDQLAKELDQLNNDFLTLSKTAKQKKFIVTHAAYGYWEERYGLEQISIAGISSTEEPSQKKLKSIVDTIKKENIPYLLFEQNIQSRLAKVVQQETGTDVLHIHNLAVLTDEEIKQNETYFTLMEKNISVLKKVLN